MSRLLVLVLACCVWLVACIPPNSTSLSTRIVAPGGVSPLLDAPRIEGLMARLPTRSGKLPGQGGVPIYWRALDPGDYRLDYRYTGNPDGSALQQVAFDVDFVRPQAPAAPRGTVVLLHGWMMDGDSLMPWALQLAQAGYRTITLDLRNHGRSGSGPAGYGTREGQDVARVVDQLRQRGEIAGPLYLFGVSYGAATAIFAAHDLGTQVAGVVAMESFANAGRGIRDMVPHMLAARPDTWKSAATTLIAQATYGRQNLDAVIAAADAQLGLNLDDVDVAGALRATRGLRADRPWRQRPPHPGRARPHARRRRTARPLSGSPGRNPSEPADAPGSAGTDGGRLVRRHRHPGLALPRARGADPAAADRDTDGAALKATSRMPPQRR
ncbi:pimeloyl-ACP methyl ester carboxylesterase [Pseudoxanthomonas sp. SORGH_AS 997]|nr:pimeloyl-ACP methyl ester carboxylesterase [Pseudoxanthomonas sp. SORGH_AS_0997]